jgi:hypothetical protein
LGYLSPPPSPQPVIVFKDVGGLVTDYEARTEQYRHENREVRLHECRSACTLALSLPNVCVYPDAQVKFHQAYNALTREVDLGVSAKLFDSYPATVRARLGYLTRQYKVLGGRELIALGVRNCQQDDHVTIAQKRPPKATPAPVQVASNAPDPLSDFARRVRVAVAGAVERPSDAPPARTTIAVPDRSATPPSTAPMRVASLAQTVDAPLPPRRPVVLMSHGDAPQPVQLSIPAVAQAAAPAIIPGAAPILAASRFYAPAPSMSAAVAKGSARAGG